MQVFAIPIKNLQRLTFRVTAWYEMSGNKIKKMFWFKAGTILFLFYPTLLFY